MKRRRAEEARIVKTALTLGWFGSLLDARSSRKDPVEQPSMGCRVRRWEDDDE